VGWKRTTERDLSVMARWLPADEAQGSINIFVVPLINRTISSVTAEMSNRFDGEVENIMLDGRPAQRMVGGRNGEAAIFAQRAGYLFDVRYIRPPGVSDPAELETIRSTWKWLEQNRPAKNPEPRTDRIEILNTITIQPPEHMRPWLVPPPPKGHVVLAAVDIGSQRIQREFWVDISIPQDIQGLPLAQIKQLQSRKLTDKFKVGRFPKWNEGRSDRILSQTLVERDLDGRLKLSAIHGVVALANGRRILFDFSITSSSTDDALSFAAMAQQIVASAEPLPAGAATKPAQ
jgi:hypothetical protein